MTRMMKDTIDLMAIMTGDVEAVSDGFDMAEKKGDVITIHGAGGTTWRMHWICPHWYWERDSMAAHPVDQRTERYIKSLCKEGLYE